MNGRLLPSGSTQLEIAAAQALSQNYGAQATVKNGTILFFKPFTVRTASGQALQWNTLVRTDGDSHTFKLVDTLAYESVTAQWHDVKKAATTSVALKRSSTQTSNSQKQHPAWVTPSVELDPPVKEETKGYKAIS